MKGSLWEQLIQQEEPTEERPTTRQNANAAQRIDALNIRMQGETGQHQKEPGERCEDVGEAQNALSELFHPGGSDAGGKDHNSRRT